MSSEVTSSGCEKSSSPVTNQLHRTLYHNFNKLVESSKQLSDLVEVQCHNVASEVEDILKLQSSEDLVVYNLTCLRDLYVGLLDQHRFFSRNAQVILSNVEIFYLYYDVKAISQLKSLFDLNMSKVLFSLTRLAEDLFKGLKDVN